MKSITPAELKDMLKDNPESMFLVDVREQEEHEYHNIGGLLIPLTEIGEKHHLIPRDRAVVLYCRMGVRSMIAIQRLEEKYGYDNLYNLSGGLEKW